jgi:hypothetical protein
VTETDSGYEESGQRDRAGVGVGKKATSVTQRNSARPKRRQEAEKAGVEKSRQSAPVQREKAVTVEKKILGVALCRFRATAPEQPL